MTEVAELIASPEVHEPGDSEDCPFCPVDDEDDSFTTHPGEANNSSVLRTIMEDPSTLVSEQSGARPKDGQPKRQSPSKAKTMPSFSADGEEYSFEAHHAISGNQAMKYHPIEDWLLASRGLIEKDTGYSINNSDNGVWLPSVPVVFNRERKGEWGPLHFDTKLWIAVEPMSKGKGQFHKGPHDITDPEDTFGTYHKSYKDELIRLLDDLNDLIMGWARVCRLCEDVDLVNGPFAPNWRVHNMLDRLSTSIAVELTMPASTWDYFISKIALEYHKNPSICEHIDHG